MKRILVAVDASPCAPSVVQAGIDLARTNSAKLLLLRAVGLPPEPLPLNGFATPPTQVLDGMMVTAKRDLAELSRRVPMELLEGATTHRPHHRDDGREAAAECAHHQ